MKKNIVSLMHTIPRLDMLSFFRGSPFFEMCSGVVDSILSTGCSFLSIMAVEWNAGHDIDTMP